ncbi:hypothetical protein ACFL6S_17630, partial [Candidatus Poribacteria bacterium]
QYSCRSNRIQTGVENRLRTFLREIIFTNDWARSCIVGPEPLNTGAIKAYKKAGFRHLKTIQLPDEDEPEYLMSVDRGEIISVPI